MRTEEEIRARLKEAKADARIDYPPADVSSNAPLALVQVELETTRDVLAWVLANPKVKGKGT